MLSKKLRGNDGAAFIEVALVLPLLTLMLVGAAEFGRIAYAAIEVTNAARAAVAYGSQTVYTALDSTGMQAAATDDAPNISSVVATPSRPCVCESITSSTGAVQTSSITICSGTTDTLAIDCPNITPGVIQYVVNYVAVSTQATVSTMFHYPGIPTSFTLKGFAKMRVQQD
jgi:Flp pilus assembly protein TadG